MIRSRDDPDYRRSHDALGKCDTEDVIKNFSGSSKMNGDWKLLTHLFEIGRERADTWLAANFDNLGVASTVDRRPTGKISLRQTTIKGTTDWHAL